MKKILLTLLFICLLGCSSTPNTTTIKILAVYGQQHGVLVSFEYKNGERDSRKVFSNGLKQIPSPGEYWKVNIYDASFTTPICMNLIEQKQDWTEEKK